MPYYRCVVPKDSVPYEQRAAVAKAFTDIHCGQHRRAAQFCPRRLDEADDRWATPYFLDGGNRAGRSEEVKAELLSDLMGAFREITGVAEEDFSGRITEGPAKWTMEGGMVLPSPAKRPRSGTPTVRQPPAANAASEAFPWFPHLRNQSRQRK